MENKQQDWTDVISPKANFLDFNFAEIWKYRDLLVLFVKRDFIATYKQTILGPIWHFVQPILTTIIFILVFGKIASIPTDGIEPALFYMSGITIWNYFTACLMGTSNAFVSNASIFGKVYFPRLILPLSTIASNIVKFAIQFLLLLAFMLYFGITKHLIYFSVWWLMIPVFVSIMAGLGLGLGIIISSLTTKYRDFTVLIGFGIQLGMYATPVAYPLSYLLTKTKHGNLINFNPLAPVVEGFRFVLFHTSQQHFDFNTLWYSVIFMFVSLFIGLALFNKVEKSFMDTV
jgi:lipopolysaccharide transport system permease protein